MNNLEFIFIWKFAFDLKIRRYSKIDIHPRSPVRSFPARSGAYLCDTPSEPERNEQASEGTTSICISMSIWKFTGLNIHINLEVHE